MVLGRRLASRFFSLEPGGELLACGPGRKLQLALGDRPVTGVMVGDDRDGPQLRSPPFPFPYAGAAVPRETPLAHLWSLEPGRTARVADYPPVGSMDSNRSSSTSRQTAAWTSVYANK